MALQSPTNPNFRCNGCKEYHVAPSKKVFFKCATHGYICQKYLVKKGDKVFRDKEFHASNKGKCKLPKKGKEGKLWNLSDYCLSKPLKFTWNQEIKRWLGEGEKVDDYKKSAQKSKVPLNKSNNEIKMLIELFEDGSISKEIFLKKIKSKI